MPKLYEDATMQMVYDMVHKEGAKRREIAELFDTDPATIESIYAAAVRRFGTPAPKAKRQIIEAQPIKTFVRAKGEYSNHSPYRIASPGLID